MDEHQDKKRDPVQEHLKEKARQTVSDLVQDINHKVARDVENRMRQLSGDAVGKNSADLGSVMCGRRTDDYSGMEPGVMALFMEYAKEGARSISLGDPETAVWHYLKCLNLPLNEEQSAKIQSSLQFARRLVSMKKSKRPE